MKLTPELLHQIEFVGRVEWIGCSPARRAPLVAPAEVEAIAGKGLAGDHHSEDPKRQKKRQVTLIQAEHIAAVSQLMGGDIIPPSAMRRNIVVAGFNLAAVRTSRFKIGDAILQGTGDCVPCALMEETIGPGGYEAMLLHGGITAVVETSGSIRIGDEVRHVKSAV